MITLIKWHKRELDNMRREMEDAFTKCYRGISEGPSRFKEWEPCLDLLETETSLIVKAELPGLEPSDLDIDIHGKRLTIQGHKRRDQCLAGESYHCVERSSGSFKRVIELPTMVDIEKVEAIFKNGVLTLTMPKWQRETGQNLKVDVH